MDKKEFLKALVIVGLINSIVIGVIAGLIWLLVRAVFIMPLVILEIAFFVTIGYVSAYIYLKFKEKE